MARVNEREREIAIVSHLITLSAVVCEEDTAQVAKLLLKCPIPHTHRQKEKEEKPDCTCAESDKQVLEVSGQFLPSSSV